jgi:hypothetical protein
MLARGELRKAERLVSPEGAPGCEPRLAALRELVRRRRGLFDAGVAAGTAHEKTDPRQALRDYTVAQRIDGEDEQIKERIRRLSDRSQRKQ